MQKIFNENCLDTMFYLQNDSIDCVITSPPYDDLRKYKGYSFPFQNIAKELYRILKPGGAIVWIVADQTINGSETGSSFKQALYFKSLGLNLHDTMIWEKPSFTATGTLKVRYACVFEYMFIFSKGKLNTFNPIKDKPNIYGGTKIHGTIRLKNGHLRPGYSTGKTINNFGQRHNVWRMNNQVGLSTKKQHPATFPLSLIEDHIKTWTNEGDLIYDPFVGSGTTVEACIYNNRRYLASEISPEYYKDMLIRIKNAEYDRL